MKKLRALSCFIFALCLVFYAVPRLPVHGISETATGFSIIWTAFAMLVIGANFMYVIAHRSGLERNSRKSPTLKRMEDRKAKKAVYRFNLDE